MTSNESPQISHFEVSRLACLNWQMDGCPHGRDLDYWLAAERQLKAPQSPQFKNGKPQTNGITETKPLKAKTARKAAARQEPGRKI